MCVLLAFSKTHWIFKVSLTTLNIPSKSILSLISYPNEIHHGPKFCRSSLPHFYFAMVAQMVKHLPAMRETKVQSPGQEDPLEKEWQPTSVFLPRKFHGWRSLVGYSPLGGKKSDMTEWLHFHFMRKWFWLYKFLRSSYASMVSRCSIFNHTTTNLINYHHHYFKQLHSRITLN